MFVMVLRLTVNVLVVIVFTATNKLHALDVHAQESSTMAQEYCEDETFTATCGKQQVVVMESARYGRMRMGRCLTSNSGSVGCSRDVLPQIDSVCSGQRTCRLDVRDLLIHNPCAKDLRGYLEVRYACLTVVSPDVQECRQRAPVSVVDTVKLRRRGQSDDDSPPLIGYLSNYVTELTGCGNIDSPWRVQTLPGQRVNLTLIDFGVSSMSAATSSSSAAATSADAVPSVCQVLAIIKDRVPGMASETVCGGRSRQRHVMLSESHDVEVRMVLQSRRDEPARYILIRYEVVGCPDISVAPDTSFKRTSSGAVIGCPQRGDIWRLTCENGRWHGEYGNCSNGIPRSGSLLTGALLQLPFGLNMTIMVAVATLIGFIVLIGGLLLVHRRLARKSSAPAAGVYYDQQKSLQYSDYHVTDRRRSSRTATPMRFAGETKSAAAFSGGCGRPRPAPPPPPPHQGPGAYLHGRPLSSNATGALLYHAIDSGLSGVDSSYVEHIYESPTCGRKDFDPPGGTGTDSLQYFEIDSERRAAGQESLC